MKNFLICFFLILCISLVGCGSVTNSTNEQTDTQNIGGAQDTSETVIVPTIEGEIASFVDTYNATSEVVLVFAEDFTPSDKSSSHYRTEFRLSAYSDAIGKSYMFGDAVVDLVGTQGWSGEISIRIYMDGATLEQCVAMIKYASPIMDPDIESRELQEAIDYIGEYKTANGYYYADLGLLLLGNESKGYEFMLKMGKD